MGNIGPLMLTSTDRTKVYPTAPPSPSSLLLDEIEESKFVEHCGVVAIINSPSAVGLTALGLSLLQHRGQDGAGIAVVSSKGEVTALHGSGKVKEALTTEKVALFPPCSVAIGHTRYGTSGGQDHANLQPLTLDVPYLGKIAIAHNGNLTNADSLRTVLKSEGCTFKSTSDTEVLLHLLAQGYAPGKNILTLVEQALSRVTGSYSLVILFPDRVIAARDPHGNRPLVVGRMDSTTIVTSEPCGWDSFHVHSFHEVPPGTLLEIFPNGTMSEFYKMALPIRPAPCLMELLYFSRPDSTIFGAQVAQFRRKMGELLYKRHPVEADLVIPLMSSGLHYAQGFSEASGIPLRFSLTKNPTAARVFIEADHNSRFQQTLEKHSLIRADIAGKRVVYVDDSIVRGVTLEQIVKLSYPATHPLRDGATEVHVRIGAPPIVGPCSYGISTPTREELAINRYGGYSGEGPVDAILAAEAVARNINATSVGFGTLQDIAQALEQSEHSFCHACFANRYDIIPR